jgi:hypothetical protein
MMAEAPAAMFADLNEPSARRTADALLAFLDDPNVHPNQTVVVPGANVDRFASCETLFRKVVPCLDRNDLLHLLDHYLAGGRLQRILLDGMAESKKRSFRNTWDYLNGL